MHDVLDVDGTCAPQKRTYINEITELLEFIYCFLICVFYFCLLYLSMEHMYLHFV